MQVGKSYSPCRVSIWGRWQYTKYKQKNIVTTGILAQNNMNSNSKTTIQHWWWELKESILFFFKLFKTKNNIILENLTFMEKDKTYTTFKTYIRLLSMYIVIRNLYSLINTLYNRTEHFLVKYSCILLCLNLYLHAM